jgi:hypothetical protein
MNDFSMPAIGDLLDNSYKRLQAIRELNIFDADVYYRDAYLPIIRELGIDRKEMRTPPHERKSLKIS